MWFEGYLKEKRYLEEEFRKWKKKRGWYDGELWYKKYKDV